MSDADVSSIIRAAAAVRCGDHPVIIAIDGRSGSGKSTIARHLAKHAEVATVEMDDFYRVDDPVARARYGPAEGVERYFDWQRLRDEALVPLSKGRSATFRVYDWKHNDYGDITVVDPQPFVVIEGVYSARPDLRPLVDLVVLIDTSPELSAARQLARGQNSNEWIERWTVAEDHYFAHVLRDSAVDLRVSGASPSDRP